MFKTYQIPSSCFPVKKEKKRNLVKSRFLLQTTYWFSKSVIYVGVPQKVGSSITLLLHSNTQWDMRQWKTLIVAYYNITTEHIQCKHDVAFSFGTCYHLVLPQAKLHRHLFFLYSPNIMGLRLRAIPLDKS